MIPAIGCVKNYHWGKVGDDSYIARFQEVASSLSCNGQSPKGPKSKISQDKLPLAELWFGSHPSGPANVIVDGQCIELDSFLAIKPEMIGSIDHYHKFNKKLPFLFKILSVGQSLSLQAHPDKKLAQVLHHKDSKNYPDSNHKPELAIALTDFEVLCDFRPSREIVQFMKVLVPFRRLVGDRNYEQYAKLVHEKAAQELLRPALAECFKSLMTKDKETIAKETKNLLSESSLLDKNLLKLIEDLERLYPGDPGVFAPFFLNYLKLSPGQAIYLKANKLHAYLKGECIECMACSDNVIRAGLTTKYRDVDTLINMLDYVTVESAHEVLITGLKRNNVISFAPTDDFKVDKIIITQEIAPNGEFTISSLLSASFLVVLSGKAVAKNFFDLKKEHNLALGSAAFIPPKIELKLNNIKDTLILYRSYC